MSPPARYTVASTVGRLIEARVVALTNVADVDDYIGGIAEAAARLPAGLQGVLCADHRPAELYTQPVTDRLTESFQLMNSRLSRVAIITGVTKRTLYMQMRRIAREAEYEARQVFQTAEPGLAHLKSVLTLGELRRAEAFLAEYEEP